MPSGQTGAAGLVVDAAAEEVVEIVDMMGVGITELLPEGILDMVEGWTGVYLGVDDVALGVDDVDLGVDDVDLGVDDVDLGVDLVMLFCVLDVLGTLTVVFQAHQLRRPQT